MPATDPNRDVFEALWKAIGSIERNVQQLKEKPYTTLPKVDSGNYPDDPVEQQIVIGDGGALQVYLNGAWHSQGGGLSIIPFSVAGTLSVGNGGLRWYASAGGTITQIHASVGTAPSGSAVIVRVNKNGSSIGTATITAGSHVDTFTPTSSNFSIGDFFTTDITAVGSGTAGSNLVVQIRL